MEIMNSKQRSFSIKLKPGVSAKNYTGMTDNRLFKGGNKLNAFQDSATCLWYLKYDIGGLPEGLKDRQFTSFKMLCDHVKKYYESRGLVAEYIDEPEDSVAERL